MSKSDEIIEYRDRMHGDPHAHDATEGILNRIETLRLRVRKFGLLQKLDLDTRQLIRDLYSALVTAGAALQAGRQCDDGEREPESPWPLHHENTCKSLFTHNENDCDCDQRRAPPGERSQEEK